MPRIDIDSSLLPPEVIEKREHGKQIALVFLILLIWSVPFAYHYKDQIAYFLHPTEPPSPSPTPNPTLKPSYKPTQRPTRRPTRFPISSPTVAPSSSASSEKTASPSIETSTTQDASLPIASKNNNLRINDPIAPKKQTLYTDIPSTTFSLQQDPIPLANSVKTVPKQTFYADIPSILPEEGEQKLLPEMQQDAQNEGPKKQTFYADIPPAILAQGEPEEDPVLPIPTPASVPQPTFYHEEPTVEPTRRPQGPTPPPTRAPTYSCPRNDTSIVIMDHPAVQKQYDPPVICPPYTLHAGHNIPDPPTGCAFFSLHIIPDGGLKKGYSKLLCVCAGWHSGPVRITPSILSDHGLFQFTESRSSIAMVATGGKTATVIYKSCDFTGPAHTIQKKEKKSLHSTKYPDGTPVGDNIRSILFYSSTPNVVHKCPHV